jgi:predicted RNase H-like nuclease (RuvC/YqgF family)
MSVKETVKTWDGRVKRLNEQIKTLKLEKQQKDMCINDLKRSLHKQDTINTYLYSALKDSDRIICELCKRLNPQYVNCTTCEEREARLRILAKAKEL